MFSPLVTLLYCYGALYISTHHKAVSGIRTGTLSKLKHSLKQLKDYDNKERTGEFIPLTQRSQRKSGHINIVKPIEN
jgi:hypothetical protein